MPYRAIPAAASWSCSSSSLATTSALDVMFALVMVTVLPWFPPAPLGKLIVVPYPRGPEVRLPEDVRRRIMARVEGYRDEMGEFQRRLTAIPGLGPDNGGEGEERRAP